MVVAMVAVGWVVVVGTIAAICSILAFLPRAGRAIKKLYRLPLIIDAIMQEFTPNGGTSMRDSINRLGVESAQTANKVKEASVEADKSHRKVAELETYLHDFSHDFTNDVTVLKGNQERLLTEQTRLVERFDRHLERGWEQPPSSP